MTHAERALLVAVARALTGPWSPLCRIDRAFIATLIRDLEQEKTIPPNGGESERQQ